MKLGQRNPTPFDPFADMRLTHASRAWLRATAALALLTCGLLLCSQRFPRFETVALVGIIATWTLALRTIRQQLLELLALWRQASRDLLQKASKSGRHLLNKTLPREISRSMWRLRIAAGLTLPFFVLPVACSFVAVFFALQPGASGAWLPLAVWMMFGAVLVAGYFQWAILPLPVPVRSSGRIPASPWRRSAKNRRKWIQD